MRLINIKSIFSLVAFSFLTMVATAQFDDLYYDPSDDSGSILDSDYTDSEDSYVYDDVEEYDSDYDSDYYDDYFDDYSYTRRINRFRRNSCGSNYYSSVFYNDPFYNSFQDPYYSGSSSLIYVSFGNSYGGYNNVWNRRNRWNTWNRWNNWNNNYYGWNNYGYNSWNNNAYCPPNYGYANGGGYYNNNVSNTTTNPNGTVYGSRRNGSVSSSTNGRTASPRLTAPNRDPESGAVSASTPVSPRNDGVRTKKGDAQTSQSLTGNTRSDETKTTTRRRSNGDTIYSGRKRSSRSSNSVNSNDRRSNQGVSRRNNTSNRRSNLGNSRNSSRNNSSMSNRSSNRSPKRSSSTRSSSSRSSTKSSNRSSSSRSTSKKRGGE